MSSAGNAEQESSEVSHHVEVARTLVKVERSERPPVDAGRLSELRNRRASVAALPAFQALGGNADPSRRLGAVVSDRGARPDEQLRLHDRDY